MSNLIKKLDNKTTNTVINEEFITEITDKSVEYELIGEFILTEQTTDADIDQFMVELSQAMWGKKLV